MTRLYINTNSLRSVFNSAIDDSIAELDDVISKVSNLDIPAGFSYRSYLRNLPESLRQCQAKCKVVKDFVANSITDFTNTSLEVCDLYNNIETVPIVERTPLIK